MISPLTPPRASIDHSFAVASHRIYIHLHATTHHRPRTTHSCAATTTTRTTTMNDYEARREARIAR